MPALQCNIIWNNTLKSYLLISVKQTADNEGQKFVAAYIENLILREEKDIKLLFTTAIPTDVSVKILTPLILPGSEGEHF